MFHDHDGSIERKDELPPEPSGPPTVFTPIGNIEPVASSLNKPPKKKRRDVNDCSIDGKNKLSAPAVATGGLH